MTSDPWAAARTDKGWPCPECGRVGEGHRMHFTETHAMHPTASMYRQEFLLDRVVSRLGVLVLIQLLLIFAGVAIVLMDTT